MAKEEAQDTRKNIAYSAVENGKDKEKFLVGDLEPVPIIGARHWQCVWYFLMLLNGYGTRVSLSVAIVAMTDPSASVNPDIPTYPEWTQRGAILSAFFWGYLWPQIFVGYITNRFGAKWFLIGTMAIQSLLMVCFPYTAASFGPMGLMVIRAVQGFCQGFFIPTIVQGLSQWAPPQERARLSSICFSSIPSGTVLSIFITGLIAAGPYGWPMVFYLYGILGLLWCLLFSFYGYNSPAVHPSISEAEKYYIQNSLGHTDKKVSHRVPLKAILTSLPTWALLFAQSGWIFGFWMLLTQIPTYMNRVMNFNIKANSMLSSLPYLTQFTLNLAAGFLSDYIINKGFIGRTNARKLFTTIGSIFPAVALVLLAYTKSSEPHTAVILLMIAVGSSAAGNAGWGVNHMDLSPNHSATLMGICNATSHILAIWAPLMVQILVTDENNPEQWKIIFFVAAVSYALTSIVYVIFGSGETQPWNSDDDKNEDYEKR